MTRILIVAASPVVRAGLDAVLASNPALEVVGRASATAALAPQVAALQPDVVVVELEGHDDPVATGMLGEVLSAAATVLLADDPRGTWAAEALRAGARAVLPREATADEIIGAVEAAAAGLVVLHPAVAATLLPLLSTPAPGGRYTSI